MMHFFLLTLIVITRPFLLKSLISYFCQNENLDDYDFVPKMKKKKKSSEDKGEEEFKGLLGEDDDDEDEQVTWN